MTANNDPRSRLRIRIGEDGWAVWANGHGFGNRFLWAAARALWRSSWEAEVPRVKDLSAERCRERIADINRYVVTMAPRVRERWMSRYYEQGGWYVELHDAPKLGDRRWPVTVWER